MKEFGIAIIFALFAVLVALFPHYSTLLFQYIEHMGLLAPIVFVLLYVLATLLFLPTLVLSVAGGAVFGPFIGTALTIIGASLGASLAFLISRHFLFHHFHSRAGKRLHQLIAGVQRQGWQFVAMMRLLPIVPFNLVNYGFGLTKIKFSHYVLATLFFLLPLEIGSTYCGHTTIKWLVHTDIDSNDLVVLFFCVWGILFTLLKAFKKYKYTVVSSPLP